MPENHVRISIETGPGKQAHLLVNKVCGSCHYVIKSKVRGIRVFDRSLHTSPRAEVWCRHCQKNVWLTAFWEG